MSDAMSAGSSALHAGDDVASRRSRNVVRSAELPIQAAPQAIVAALQLKAGDTQQMAEEHQALLRLESAISFSCEAANSHISKNRYLNVLPYDYNRVKLGGPADYVNASHVEFSTREVPLCRYIATQGPLSTTAADFWEMICIHECRAIVMLTNTTEKGVSKCALYFPARAGEAKQFRHLGVSTTAVMACGDGVTKRGMVIINTLTGLTTQVEHYHYHAWPDQGTPDSSCGIRQLSQLLGPAQERSGPVVVHCSAGIGRTGTFCTIDITLQRLKRWSQDFPSSVQEVLNLMPLVHRLRQQRMGMVQTHEQLALCYAAAADELLCRLDVDRETVE